MSHPATRPGADILLADGSTARVRQIIPGDAEAIVRMHGRLSERTRYLRYFAATPRIGNRDLERVVNVDHRDREAFVVELGGEIIAVGQYDRASQRPADAEVAFVVEDTYQRRGLGSVLLEHLVAAAREEGVVNFVADVLPVNATMLRVFSQAGYPVEQRYVDGLVHISFPIAPTPQSLAVQRAREHHADAASIARLLSPRGVAVYGARSDGTGVGAALLRHLLSGATGQPGFAGTVYPVHPSAATLLGVPATATLAEAVGAAQAPADLAVIVVPAEVVPAAVADCAAAGVHGLVVVSAGFAEAGADGARAQAKLVRQARDRGMRLIGPNCLGIANTRPAVRLNATLAPRLPGPGRVGVFSQSAALGSALIGEAERRGLGLSSFVSVGNRADVSGNDLLQYWRDDPATEVVLLYMETWGNPRKFVRIARELAHRKPIVAVAGTGRPPALAAVAAGPDERGVAALFASSGVIRVDTVRELFDVGVVLADQPLPSGSRLGVVTNAAALGALAGASAPGAGLELPPGYPLDVGPAATVAAFAAATRRALADPRVDSVVAAYAPGLADDWEAVVAVSREVTAVVAAAATKARRGAVKPVVAVFPITTSSAIPAFSGEPGVSGKPAVCGEPAVSAGPGASRSADRGPGPRVPTFRGVEEAVFALGKVTSYANWRREPPGTTPLLPDVDSAKARGVVARLAVSSPEVRDDTDEINELLACYGIHVVPSRRVRGTASRVADVAVEVGFPVALKLATVPWRHRIDLGGTRLQLDSAAAVVRAYDDLRRVAAAAATAGQGPAGPGQAGPGGAGWGNGGSDGVEVLVQPMIAPGVACVVETVDDPAFGQVVGFGLGGVASELLGDQAWRSAPLTTSDAYAMLRGPRAAPLLTGYRGSVPVDLASLAGLLVRVGRLVDDHPRLRKMELNPVIARPEGFSVLHATVQVGKRSVRPDSGPRRLSGP